MGYIEVYNYFPLDTQNEIILACCLIYNFLREVDAPDLLEEEILPEDEEQRERDLQCDDDGDVEDVEDVDDQPIDDMWECPEW